MVGGSGGGGGGSDEGSNPSGTSEKVPGGRVDDVEMHPRQKNIEAYYFLDYFDYFF